MYTTNTQSQMENFTNNVNSGTGFQQEQKHCHNSHTDRQKRTVLGFKKNLLYLNAATPQPKIKSNK